MAIGKDHWKVGIITVLKSQSANDTISLIPLSVKTSSGMFWQLHENYNVLDQYGAEHTVDKGSAYLSEKRQLLYY